MDRTQRRWAWVLGVTLGLLATVWIVGVGSSHEAAEISSQPAAAAAEDPLGGPDETYSFTYQGRLDYDGQPADGFYDFVVQVWTAEQAGTMVADCVDVHMPGGLLAYPVEKGLFTFYLVCGPLDNREIFTGQNLWLQVYVRPAGGGSYTPLPRQPIAAAPYAFSLYPGAVISGTVSTPSGVGGTLAVVNASGVGIHSQSRGSNLQAGYAAYLVSQNFRALYAISEPGWYDAYFAGIGGICSVGGYYSLKADRFIAVNAGQAALRPGDVVAIAGVGELPDGSPVLAVRPADAASTAVVGIVAQAMEVQVPAGRVETLDVQPVGGEVSPGGYLAIVTSGLVLGVRVQAPEGLQVGDWLTVSPTPGVAAKAEAEGSTRGALLGRVAGPVDPSTGTVPVFVIVR